MTVGRHARGRYDKGVPAWEQMDRLRHDMGLDEPLITQYLLYTSRLLQGDLGLSIRSQRPALELVLERFPATLELTAAGISFVGDGLRNLLDPRLKE